MHPLSITSVRERARHRCEYCQLPKQLTVTPFHIDHIVALKHGGDSSPENLAFACFYCNSFKGPNIAGIDPDTLALSPLFHPRRNRWSEHFRWNGPVLLGITASGRATVAVLRINDPNFVTLRASLIDEGVFPPLSISQN